jgi:hypothetical protein
MLRLSDKHPFTDHSDWGWWRGRRGWYNHHRRTDGQNIAKPKLCTFTIESYLVFAFPRDHADD